MPAIKRSPSSEPDKKPAKPYTKKAASGSKKMGTWTGEELKMLYEVMCPKRTGVKWEEVAAQIPGRDAKACSNKWTRMQTKIMAAVQGLGD